MSSVSGDGPGDAGSGQHGRRGEPSDQYANRAATNDLASSLGEFARDLQRLHDRDELLAEVVSSGIALIPGAEQGSIAEIRARRRIEHKAASSDLPKRVDGVMGEFQQGPCLDVVWDQRTVRVDDLAAETRWPEFCHRAVELGARSMLSFQLFVDRDNLGALNVYSSRPYAFSDESEDIRLLVASHAALALYAARAADNHALALDTRGTIGQAVGILRERYKLDADQAFAVLVRFSQHSNRKLRDIATDLILDIDNRSVSSLDPGTDSL